MKKISIKKILLYSIPVLLILSLALVYKYKSDNDDQPGNNTQNAILIPNAEKENEHANKVEAYKKEDEEKRNTKRIAEASKVKNSDFFKEIEKLDKSDEDAPKQGETIEEYYERTVGSKMRKETSPKTRSDIEKQSNFINVSTVKSSYIDEESDIVQEEYARMWEKQQAALEAHNAKSIPAATQSENSATKLTEKTHVATVPDDGKRRRNKTTQTSSNSNFIKAAIHGDQTVSSGETVRLRLLEDAEIGGKTTVRNTIIYGIAHLGKDRMDIDISSLEIDGMLINVEFDVYDVDAIKGLNLPESVKAGLAKRAASNSTDQVNFNSASAGGGIVGTAISTGVNTIKQVTKKEMSQIRVSLKANYNIYIKNKKI